MTFYKFLKYTFFLLFTACSTSNFIFEENNNNGVNFKEGKWLIFPINVPYTVSKEINKLVAEDFNKLTPNRFSFSNTLKINLPIHADSKINETDLENIKTVSGYDYFVMILGDKKSNDLGSIDFTNHKLNKEKSNSAYISLLIYDLNRKEILVSQKITGSFSIPEGNNSDVTFNRSASSLLVKGYKKIIKKLKSHSIYK